MSEHSGAPRGSLIFPIGQYVGAFTAADRPGERSHHICGDGRVAELTEESFAVWAMAHGPLDPIIASSAAWTRRELEQYAGRAGVAGTARLIEDLAGRGLLAETPLQGPAARAFADGHRAVPTMLGLGNTAEDPERFTIGFFDSDVLEVGEGLYELWAWSGADGNLWRVCETHARLARVADDIDPEATDPSRVLALLLAGTHALLSAGAMYLDRAAQQ
jgi:hypothetical protein